MKKISILTFVSCLLICGAFTTDKPAYLLYNANGQKASYEKMIKELAKADVVFFGEYHNNPVSHWLEYEVTKSLYREKEGNITIGAEMFEADNQLILDEYMSGKISAKKFEDECRLWGNYSTDYDPLVTFAKDSSIQFVATNIPRRYADIVHKQGTDQLETLSEEAKRFIAPLPVEMEPDSVLMAGAGIMGMMSKNPLGIAKAQAIKDATMAYFIAKNYIKGRLFIHYNGSYHSDGKDGIIKYLKKYNPELRIKTITTAQQEQINKLDSAYHQQADYVICVVESMTKTY
jgi:uncharacterized iron-regulated protein